MEKLKIAFFGTSDRSIPILEALNKEFDVVLCVTKNDVLVGRHQEKKPVDVKVWATKNNINVVTVSSLKFKDLETVNEQLNYAKPDYIVVADFSYIIPEELIEAHENKIINVHFSLLPKYRGASPVQFAILNGDETTGISYNLTVSKMDRGDILHQIGYKMSHNETSGFLYETLFELAAREIPNVIRGYQDGTLVPRPQNEAEATYTFSPTHANHTLIYKEDARIDWKNFSVEQIERCVRAYHPWPIAWTTLGELENNKKLWDSKLNFKQTLNKESKVKIYATTITPDKNTLIIKELQLEGKNKMLWEEFENGNIDKAPTNKKK